MKIDYDRLLRFTREEMYQQCFDCTATFPASDRHYDNAKLLISVVDISKVSMCPLSEVSEHLIRVVSQLLKVIVSGTSETDLRWANPATLFPLRIQAFATLLQLLGSCTIFSSKRGLSQLDGSNKWNVIALSRVLALAFDEGSLFGDYAAEMLNKDVLLPKMAPPVSKTPLSKEKRRRHVRSNFEFLNNAPGGDNQQNVSDENGGNDIFAATSAPDKSSFSTTAKSVDESLKKDETLPIKVDSVTDFRSALKAGSDSVEDDGLLYDGSSTGSPAAMAMVKAYSGPQAMSRRWMTAPSTGLATIREDIDDDADNSAKLLHKPPQPRKDKGPLDSLDTELLVKAPTSSVKQMRVPKILKKESDQGSTFKKYGTVDLVPKPPQSNHLQSVFGSDQNQELQSM